MNRFWQELKSISQAAKLLNSVTTRVRLLRANQEVELDRKEVVPGDVLVLTSSYSLRLLVLVYADNRDTPRWRRISR